MQETEMNGNIRVKERGDQDSNQSCTGGEREVRKKTARDARENPAKGKAWELSEGDGHSAGDRTRQGQKQTWGRG